MAVRIVTDSTADLPAKLAAEYGIGVVPLNVHFGDEILKDGDDIWSDEFYHRLKNDQVIPSTSQPGPNEFLQVYRKIAQPGDTIISIHISLDLSGTSSSAHVAAQLLGDGYQVIIVDSRSVSMGLGMLVLRAAKLAQNGVDPQKIVDSILGMLKEVTIYFTVNSLEYLHRNGRIGKAAAMLGSLLNIKPLLAIVDGVIVPVEKVRGSFSKVALEMVENLERKYGKVPLAITYLHTEIPEAVQILQRIAEEHLNIVESYSSVIGPVVGSHSGPNTIGIVALPVK